MTSEKTGDTTHTFINFKMTLLRKIALPFSERPIPMMLQVVI